MVSPLAASVLSFSREVVDVLGSVTSSPQAGWDVVDLLWGLAHPASIHVVMLVRRDGGRDVVHVLRDGGLVIVVIEVVVQVLAWRDWERGLEFGKVGWHVIGLLSDWPIRDVFTDGWREVIDLKGKNGKVKN